MLLLSSCFNRLLSVFSFVVFFFSLSCHHRDLHVLTHSCPTRRSSDLPAAVPLCSYHQMTGIHNPRHDAGTLGRHEARSPSDTPPESRSADRKSTRLNSSH